MAAFPYPFPGTLEELLEIQESIPIDDEVPFAKNYRALYEESGGSPWGPQSTDRSKLAIRLWFAGWSRKQIMEVGLDPKHVENFRSNKGLTTGRPGRSVIPNTTKLGATTAVNPVLGSALAASMAVLEEQRTTVINKIAALQYELSLSREELNRLDFMLKAGRGDVNPEDYTEYPGDDDQQET